MDDAKREAQIELAKMRMLFAATQTRRRHWLAVMERLIKARSPEQVAKMEQERRIA